MNSKPREWWFRGSPSVCRPPAALSHGACSTRPGRRRRGEARHFGILQCTAFRSVVSESRAMACGPPRLRSSAAKPGRMAESSSSRRQTASSVGGSEPGAGGAKAPGPPRAVSTPKPAMPVAPAKASQGRFSPKASRSATSQPLQPPAARTCQASASSPAVRLAASKANVILRRIGQPPSASNLSSRLRCALRPPSLQCLFLLDEHDDTLTDWRVALISQLRDEAPPPPRIDRLSISAVFPTKRRGTRQPAITWEFET
jgi:hypothetical protein